eukprot:105569-Hanusia_phi.AAC.3
MRLCIGVHTPRQDLRVVYVEDDTAEQEQHRQDEHGEQGVRGTEEAGGRSGGEGARRRGGQGERCGETGGKISPCHEEFGGVFPEENLEEGGRRRPVRREEEEEKMMAGGQPERGEREKEERVGKKRQQQASRKLLPAEETLSILTQ